MKDLISKSEENSVLNLVEQVEIFGSEDDKVAIGTIYFTLRNDFKFLGKPKQISKSKDIVENLVPKDHFDFKSIGTIYTVFKEKFGTP